MTGITVGGKSMPSVASALRERVHPLHQIRRVPLLRRALTRADVPVWATVHGVRWKVRVRLVRDLSYRLLRRSPEPHVTALVEAAVDLFRPRTFWDVGAYFGYYGLLVKSLDSEISVVFCEPDPENASLIHETLGRLPVNGARLIEAAVSAAAGRASFVADPVSGATGSLTAGESAAYRNWGESRLIDVETVTLDDVVGGDAALDMLKIDVEGHEEDVVRGGLRTLERCRPLVLFECFHGGGDICECLEQLGYEVFDAERFGPCSGQTSNFFALPPQHRARKDDLVRGARARLEAR